MLDALCQDARYALRASRRYAESIRGEGACMSRRITAAASFLAASALLGVIARAQAGGGLSVRVGDDQLVSTSLPARPLVEPHLAANPRNAQHLVGAATVSVTDEANLSQTRCVVVTSFDGARTWVTHEFDFQGCNDPWVTILDDGTAIFVGLEIIDRRPVHLWLFRSPDGGRTWLTPPHSFGAGHDHATLVVDRSGGRFDGALYVVSADVTRDPRGQSRAKQFVARSMDGGKSFAQITEIAPTNLGSATMTAAVLPDGVLVVPMRTFERYVDDSRRPVHLQHSLEWTIRSDDGGDHFGAPRFVSDRCAGELSGFSAYAVDLSNGHHRGRLYAVCHDGPRSGPHVTQSDDGGDRWSDPVPVPTTPPTDASGQRRVASIAVNRDGIVAVSWHDRGPDPLGKCWEVFVALSGDGSESFTDARKVSTTPSCPAAGENGYAATRWPFGGEYSGLAAAADGTFHLFWPDSRGERYELRTAQVRVTK
jgi:hypothetical protein